MTYTKGEILIHRKTGKRYLIESTSPKLIELQEDGKVHTSSWPVYEVDSDFIYPPDLVLLLEVPYTPSGVLRKSPVECHRIMNNQRRALKIAVEELSSQSRSRDSVLHLILKELTKI